MAGQNTTAREGQRRLGHSGTVEVGTTASLLGGLAEDGGSNYTVRADTARITFQNIDPAASIYFAPNPGLVVTDAAHQGIYLGPYDVWVLDWPKADIDLLYFRATAANTRMRVLEESL